MDLPAFNLEDVSFLIVDDNPNMRVIVKRTLRALGARHMEEAANGADALAVLAASPVDIVIVDWEMTPVDGIEFTRSVRTSPESPNPYLPVIMLSGHTEMVRVTRARDAGITEFLAKPVSATRLYTRIVSVIQRPRPFVRTPTYFGPDRRRQDDPRYRGPDRREAGNEQENEQKDAG